MKERKFRVSVPFFKLYNNKLNVKNVELPVNIDVIEGKSICQPCFLNFGASFKTTHVFQVHIIQS